MAVTARTLRRSFAATCVMIGLSIVGGRCYNSKEDADAMERRMPNRFEYRSTSSRDPCPPAAARLSPFNNDGLDPRQKSIDTKNID
jgi:hypothetical protein